LTMANAPSLGTVARNTQVIWVKSQEKFRKIGNEVEQKRSPPKLAPDSASALPGELAPRG
jgi:hypothetical protein